MNTKAPGQQAQRDDEWITPKPAYTCGCRAALVLRRVIHEAVGPRFG